MSDLQDLFARLKASSVQEPSIPSSRQQPTHHSYQHPSASSPLFSPLIHPPNPQHASNVISPASRMSPYPPPGQGMAESVAQNPEQNRAKNLLNLLRFNGQQPGAGGQGGPMQNLQNVQGSGVQRSGSATSAPHGLDTSRQRPLSAADLVASLQRKPSAPGVLPSPMAAAGAEVGAEPTAGAVKSPDEGGNPQDFLLNLLKPRNQTGVQTQPSTHVGDARPSIEPSEKQSEAAIDKLAQSFADASFTQPKRQPTPVRQFGSPSAGGMTKFEAPQPTKANMFSYVNPFDQLHASSPLNRSPAPPSAAKEKKIEILKHDRSASGTQAGDATGPAAKSRKLASPEPVIKQELESETRSLQSVAEKLEGVGERVDQQVSDALAQADGTAQSRSTIASSPTTQTKGDSSQAANDDVDSNWSTAEDEDTAREAESQIPVYNFPMKPFVSLTLTNTHIARPFLGSSWDAATPIAKLKKDFSHDDRCLATASQSHIVYPSVPTNKKPETGFKVIRQDDGKNKLLYASAHERVSSVQIASAGDSDVESVLATGVNGSVFYTTLAKSRGEFFDEDDVASQGFIMPALPTFPDGTDTSNFTSSSAIKTRARLSHRRPADFFAVARGRQIHILAPEIVKGRRYTDHKTRKVNSEKYVAEHSLSINTGKAGKDFCFSEDDTVIASLDKTGRVKFWDIRALAGKCDASSAGSQKAQAPVEVKEPVFTFTAAAAGMGDEKMSPSSVMFLDKERPCTRGVALRYVLLGFSQNRLLQLWDLGLGKCVQELRFPDNTRSDEGANGICSLAYHPKTGILTVGHPGRNSVYFIHLSAPKYNLSNMSQAQYLALIAKHDPALPQPDSTAIMSGMREYTLGKTGDLRSVDMLKTPVLPEGVQAEGDDEVLFELYFMHSKGVVGLPIRRNDLGWDAKGKMVKPVDGLETGVVRVGDLVLGKAPPSDASSQPDLPAKRPSKREREAVNVEAALKRESPASATATSAANAAPTTESPVKQIPEATNTPAQAATNPPLMTAASYAMAAQRAKPQTPAKERAVRDAATPAPQAKQIPAEEPPTTGRALTEDVAEKLASASIPDVDVQALLSKQFDSLYQKLDQDKRVADATGAAKQDAMLRLVSSTLTENVESSLHKIVGTSIEQKVIPTLTNSTGKIVEKKLGEVVSKQVIGDAVAKEVKAALPAAVQAALNDQQVVKAIAGHVVDEVTKQVKIDVGQLLQQSMRTLQNNMGSQTTQSSQTAQKAMTDMEARLGRQLQEAETQRHESNAMIAQLSANLRSLSAMVESMKPQQAASVSQAVVDGDEEAATDPQQEPEDEDVARIVSMLQGGDFENATIEWLQSSRQTELFDNLFVRINPLYIQQVTPLVALSVSAAVTSSFDNHVDKRLEWLGTVLSNIDTNDGDIKDVAPKIMDVLSQRLQGAYMQISETQPGNVEVLRKMSGLNRQIGEVRRVLG